MPGGSRGRERRASQPPGRSALVDVRQPGRLPAGGSRTCFEVGGRHGDQAHRANGLSGTRGEPISFLVAVALRAKRVSGPMWSKDAAVAYHTVRLDDQLGDYELIEYDEHDAVVTRTVMRHPRGGEPGELIRFASHGGEIVRKTYTDPVGHPRVRVIAGPHAGQSGKLGVTIRNEHAGEIKQRVDIAVDAKRTKSIFVDPADVEQLD